MCVKKGTLNVCLCVTHNWTVRECINRLYMIERMCVYEGMNGHEYMNSCIYVYVNVYDCDLIIVGVCNITPWHECIYGCVGSMCKRVCINKYG